MTQELKLDGYRAARLRKMIAEAENIETAANLELAQGVKNDDQQYFRLFTLSVSQGARRRALIEAWELLAGERWAL